MAGYPYTFPNYGGFNAMPSYNPQNFAPAPVQTPTQPQTVQSGVTSPSGFSCRPVTSRLEAEAVQVDFLGPGTIMPDLGHGVIYLKRFNPNTGASDFVVFAMEQLQEAAPVRYAPLDAMENLREEIESLKGEIEALKKPRKAVKRNDEYDDE